MNAKKVICIICCFILAFTLLSGPWRAEAEAAGPAIAVAVVAIVGFFIVTAGYTFDSQADFRSVTDAFMESDAAEYVTKINEIVTSVATAGISLANFNLAKITSQPWFLEFWTLIQDYFGSGEVETGTVTAPTGYAYFNGTLLPDLPTVSEYDWLYSTFNNATTTGLDYGWNAPCIFEDSNYYYLYFFRYDYAKSCSNKVTYLQWYNESSFPNDQYQVGAYDYTIIRETAYATARFYVLKSRATISNWTLWNKYSASDGSYFAFFVGDKGIHEGKTVFNLLWTSYNFKYWSGIEGHEYGDVFLAPSTPVTSIQGDVIGVYEDENIIPPSDVIGGFDAAGIDGSIDWALSSSAVYQDLTTAGTVPMTSTQSTTLTEAGVTTQTAVKVEAMDQYARPSLTNVFPFCIPFDIYRFLNILAAEREAPHFEFELDFGAELGAHSIEVDLSEWETVAAILRTIELLGFCVGLAFATSKVIKW